MLNRIILIGRMVADPEIRYTQSGIAMVNFRLAVDRRYKSASGEKETDFINIVAWRKTAELVGQYLKKGKLVAVEGSLQQRSYQTREGEKRTIYEVQADSVQFIDRSGTGSGAPGAEFAPPPPTDEDAPAMPDYTPPNMSMGDSELPF